jgi:hypothetical protein
MMLASIFGGHFSNHEPYCPRSFIALAMAALGVTLAVGHPGPSFAQTWNMYGGTRTVFVPYANATSNASLNDSPSLNLGFNGSASSARFTMDTGSVGIVASPNFFTPAAGAQNLGPGHQIYSSSGVVENGTWYSSTEDIRDATGKVVATADVQFCRSPRSPARRTRETARRTSIRRTSP